MPNEEIELVLTQGFMVGCRNCHHGLSSPVDTMEEAEKEAKIHLSITEKRHEDHTMFFTPTTIVRRKK